MELENFRVIQIVSGLEISDGGPSYSVPRLNEALSAAGGISEIFTDQGSRGPPHVSGTNIRIFRRKYTNIPLIRKLHFAPDLASALADKHEHIQLLHSHGLWRMPNIYAAQAASRRRIPLIVSPRGMMSSAALGFSKIDKTIFSYLAQNNALDRTTCFHATSVSEYEDIRAAGYKQPVAIIPNGVDLPDSAVLAQPLSPNEPYVLSLGRMHPKKALDSLIRAWARVQSAFPHVRLKIVGPTENDYDRILIQLANELSLSSVDISGPVYGLKKLELLAGAEVFALSTLSENFGNTVVESLACGVPVISTIGAPWSALEENGCGWWVDHGAEAMAAALHAALSLSAAERRAMGGLGRAWMARDFSWQAVASNMLEVYRWSVIGGEVPNCVRI